MIKHKCGECKQWHGGFHLCPGPDAPSELRKGSTVYKTDPTYASQSKADAARERWARHWDVFKERDLKILEMYNDGMSLRGVAKHYDLRFTTVKSIVQRLGGHIRTRAEQQGANP